MRNTSTISVVNNLFFLDSSRNMYICLDNSTLTQFKSTSTLLDGKLN